MVYLVVARLDAEPDERARDVADCRTVVRVLAEEDEACESSRVCVSMMILRPSELFVTSSPRRTGGKD